MCLRCLKDTVDRPPADCIHHHPGSSARDEGAGRDEARKRTSARRSRVRGFRQASRTRKIVNVRNENIYARLYVQSCLYALHACPTLYTQRLREKDRKRKNGEEKRRREKSYGELSSSVSHMAGWPRRSKEKVSFVVTPSSTI